MGEVPSETALLKNSDASLINIDDSNWQTCNSGSESHLQQQEEEEEAHPKDEWLPLTESRNGNAFFAALQILNSNIGFQALMLPIAFATLGWVWGTICLSVAFVWQLYTIFLLIQLHESVPGIRHSRFFFLAMAAFGKRLGKVAALFPVMYLSGGTCVMLIITGGGTMKLLFQTLSNNDGDAHSPSGIQCFFMFTCVAILIAQLPNLNSMAMVSLVGAVTSITYCTLFWVLSVKNANPNQLFYTSSLSQESTPVSKINDVLNSIGFIVLAFRGHNVLLEIQGTLPSNLEQTSKKPMRRAVSVSYIVISMCVFPVAIGGFWAYGNKVKNGGLLDLFGELQKKEIRKLWMGAIYVIVIIHCLSSYQVYAMPVFDNMEIRYTSVKNKKCSGLVRRCMRLLFGGLTFFISVTFPFLPTLSTLLGSITLLPVTYAYPCFMWVSLKKPPPRGLLWFFNLALGSLAMLLSALLLAAAIRTLALYGLNATFFKP